MAQDAEKRPRKTAPLELRIGKWDTVPQPDPTALGRAAEAFVRAVLASDRQQARREDETRSTD